MLLEDGRSIKMIDFGTARDLGRTAKDRRPPRRASTPKVMLRRSRSSASPSRAATCLPWPAHCTICSPARRRKDSTPPANWASSCALRQVSARRVPLVVRADQDQPGGRATGTLFLGEIKADLEKRQITREVMCPRCQQTNKVREPYCSRCAGPLTDNAPPCHNCGKTNRMGSQYCIYCGNRLR